MALDHIAARRIVLPALAGRHAIVLVTRHDLNHPDEALETLGRFEGVEPEVDEHFAVPACGRVFAEPYLGAAQTLGHRLPGAQHHVRQEFERIEGPERTVE